MMDVFENAEICMRQEPYRTLNPQNATLRTTTLGRARKDTPSLVCAITAGSTSHRSSTAPA